jgi:hypothetical protein
MFSTFSAFFVRYACFRLLSAGTRVIGTTIKSGGAAMTTFSSRDDAYSRMQMKNRAYRRAGNYRDTAVLVDGPGDNEATVMSLSEAIDGGFLYEWSC